MGQPMDIWHVSKYHAGKASTYLSLSSALGVIMTEYTGLSFFQTKIGELVR
jgi:hypothetical protein